MDRLSLQYNYSPEAIQADHEDRIRFHGQYPARSAYETFYHTLRSSHHPDEALYEQFWYDYHRSVAPDVIEREELINNPGIANALDMIHSRRYSAIDEYQAQREYTARFAQLPLDAALEDPDDRERLSPQLVHARIGETVMWALAFAERAGHEPGLDWIDGDFQQVTCSCHESNEACPRRQLRQRLLRPLVLTDEERAYHPLAIQRRTEYDARLSAAVMTRLARTEEILPAIVAMRRDINQK